jgi:hypothetical protein
MRTLSSSLRGGMFHHELTETCLGGPFGVKWVAMALLRAYWCFQQLCSGRLPPGVAELNVDIEAEGDIVLQDVDWLLAEIQMSAKMLNHARVRRTDREWSTMLIDMPQFQRYSPLRDRTPSVSMVREIKPDAHDIQDTASGNDEPPLRGILKSSGSAPCNLKQQVVIEVPTIGMY